MKKYQLEKTLWTERDFSQMGWHDANIWGLLAKEDTYQYCVDLDYIFQWVHPEENEKHFKFWVSPVTMVFDNAFDVFIKIESQFGKIEVADFYMKNKRKSPNGKFYNYDFIFICQEGEIKLTATNYKMYVREYPKLLNSQCLSFAERGGISFDDTLIERLSR